uniref:Uncharacterized protein n=1 Tax=Arundo donax TaxID=35708 RepID=A0A0A8XZ78_ARUDO
MPRRGGEVEGGVDAAEEDRGGAAALIGGAEQARSSEVQTKDERRDGG